MHRPESCKALGLDCAVGVCKLKGGNLRKPIWGDLHQSQNQGTMQLDTIRDTYNHSFFKRHVLIVRIRYYSSNKRGFVVGVKGAGW